MLTTVPSFVSVIFVLTTMLTLYFFHFAIKNSTIEKTRNKARVILYFMILWLALQAMVSLDDFYSSNTHTVPPRFLLLVLPPLALIVILFITQSGRRFIDSLPVPHLTLLHVVRFPVEITLFFLAFYKAVPLLMTFEGRNFDILSGLSAPLIAFLGFRKKLIGNKFILFWNVIALALLVNIVTNAILSAPFTFQQFAFDQPNKAVFYFPFSWLPCFIVPVVLFSHLVSIRRLLKS